jgi:GNAT superfamily N-acetyltransferase
LKKLFVFNNNLSKFQSQLQLAYNQLIVTQDVKKITLDQLSIQLLKEAEIDVVIADTLPIDWIYILRGMRIVSLVLGDTEKYHQEADIVIDYLGSDSVKYFSGPLFSMENKNFDITEVSDIIYKMNWDSDFFGFPIAFIGSRYLTENIQFLVDKFTKENKIKLIEYLCNCHDDVSVKIAEKNGYHFTDIRITFTKKIEKSFVCNKLDDGLMFNIAKPEHIYDLKFLTNSMYKDSRYYYDGNFSFDKINTFYSEWIEKAVNGQFDHECYCLFYANKPFAFCTLRYSGKNSTIGLFGVSSNYAGKGYGKILLSCVLNLLKEKGFDSVQVVTQGRNYNAQRLYQSVGFRTFKTELWYHKWTV